MPITRSIDRDHRVIRFVISGVLSTDEMTGAISDAAAEVGFAKGYRVLSDHRSLTAAATPPQVQTLIAHLGSLAGVFGGSRWAIVTTQAASYGMMRQLAQYAALIPIEVQLFAQPDDAEAWLASPPSTPEPR